MSTRTTYGLAILLGCLSGIGPFSIDAYLPSFHDIGTQLQASPIAIQQTISVFLGAFLVMTLWHGALSDSFGRRQVILVGVAVYSVASLGCTFSNTLEQLIFFRAIQGLSAGCGMIISRAIVRDLYDGAQAQKLMAHIAMTFALAPIIAPIIGGYLQIWLGWRAVFGFLSLLGITLWIIAYLYLEETLPVNKRIPFSFSSLLQGYIEILTSFPFVIVSSTLALCFGGFFIYVLASPVFLMDLLKLEANQFHILFIPLTIGMLLGSWVSAHIAEHWQPKKTLCYSFAIMLSAALANYIINLYPLSAIPWSILPMPFYTLGMSMAMPTLTLLALDLFPERRGITASCHGFIHNIGSTILAIAIVPLAWTSTLNMALSMLVMIILSALSLYALKKI